MIGIEEDGGAYVRWDEVGVPLLDIAPAGLRLIETIVAEKGVQITSITSRNDWTFDGREQNRSIAGVARIAGRGDVVEVLQGKEESLRIDHLIQSYEE